MIQITTKICNTCGVEKPIGDFYKNKTTKDKHANICKECDNARRLVRYYDNWEDERARLIEWKVQNPDYDMLWHRKYRARKRQEMKQ